MGLYNNVPTFTYISATGVTVTYNKEVYTVQSFYTNKKYIYWDIDNPTMLQASDTMPIRSTKRHLVLINDNGIATTVPSTSDNFEISYSGDSNEAIKSKIFALYEKNSEFENKFVAIEENLDGIKQIVGSSEDNEEGTLIDRISKIEQTSDKISASVENIKQEYADDKEVDKLRENLSSSIIKLNSLLGTFKSEITSYFKNNEISEDESVKINEQLLLLKSHKDSFITYADTVRLIAEKEGQTNNIIALESAMQAVENSHTNLENNITNAIIDRVISPSEVTIVTDGFAKFNLRITELKNLCDDVIFLGVGGTITEELANISVKSDEIRISVSKTEEELKSDLSLQKLELEGQINDVSSALTSFETVVNTVFKDGIISEAEKSLLNEKIAYVDKEKLDVDIRYESIVNDEHLSENIKTTLVTRYNNYCNKHNELKTKINDVISDGFVNEAEKNEVDLIFKQYSNSLAYFSEIIGKAAENISSNLAAAELAKAKNELKAEINDVKDSITEIGGVIDGSFEDNILDEVERRNITQNLETLSREKLDIDKTYEELYKSIYLVGQDKVDFKNKYDNYISKYNEVVKVSNDILNKEELLSDIDRANLNSAVAKHKEAISLFHTQANIAIDVISTNKVIHAKEEIGEDISDLRGEIGDLNNYIDGTFKDNVIDSAERKSIAQNIDILNREKADIDKTYELLYSNKYLDGSVKTNLENSYNDFISKHNETLNVIQSILDKETLINDTDRENMEASFIQLNSSLATFISATNEASEYITNKSIEHTKNELKEEIRDANERIDEILDDVGGAIADGIIDEAEAMVIAKNIDSLNKERLDLDLRYETIYNNPDLMDEAIKGQLVAAKLDFDEKIDILINLIIEITDDSRVIDLEKSKLEIATNDYNISFANLSNSFEVCVDSIAKKKAEDVSNILSKELEELQDALGGLEETMNSTFKDGILSDAEKKAIQQNLKTLETSKLNIDKQYDVVYNNPSLEGVAKTDLKNSYNTYISKYNSLVVVVNDILSKVGLLVESDNVNLNNAFKAHNTAMSLYNEKINIAIDYIVKNDVEKAKNELSNDINDLNNALGDLEENMHGAFQDGILTEAEKLSIKQHLLNLSSEKSDIDKQYSSIYANEHLVGDSKTNLNTAYNNYVAAYTSLVTVINEILNKAGLIDSVDRNNLDDSFRNHNTKLGLYTASATNALDAIAKKKVEESEEKTNKIIAEIITTNNSITSRVENIETNVSNQEKRLETAEQKITSEAITNTVKESFYTKDDIDGKGFTTQSQVQQTINGLEIKFAESGGYNLLYNGDFKRKLESWTQDVTDSFGWTDGLSCKNGRGVYSRGALQTTKALRQQNIPLDVNEDTYTLSYWQYTTPDGTDGTTNPFRNIEVAIGYTDGTWSYHSTHQSNFGVWERKVIKITRPSDKHFQKANVGLWCRDTTKMVYFSQIVFEEGDIAHQWSPNPNEVSDGITTITKDGITVKQSDISTYTEMDASSFRVSDAYGGTVAEFAQTSSIPNLTVGTLTVTELSGGNVCSKSPKAGDIHFIYVNGSTGNDNNLGTSASPYKTVQRAISDINDKQDQSVTIYVYNSVPGFELKGVSGTGIITLSLQDSAIINGNVIIGGVTNLVKIVNETGSLKATFKNGISIYRCMNVDIYGVTFRGVNGSGNNILVQDTNYCAVNSCDLGGLSTRLDCAIAVKASLLWLHGCRGSNILDVVGQYAFSHVMMARGGTSNVPDYSNGLLVNYDGAGRIQNWSGGTFTKTPSSGWNPSYTPSSKTQTWSFNKIWSDETLNGWSDRQELIQGYASTWSTGRWTGYMQMTDGMAGIRSTISGGTNLSGRIYVQRKTSSGNSTGSKLCLYASDGTTITTTTTIDRGQGVWVSLPSSIISKIQSGAITYFYLKANTNNASTYFKCESNAKIEITYTK